MEIVTRINLDMTQKSNPPVVYAVQGEYGVTRVVEAHLFNNGNQLPSLERYNVSVVFKKPDGTSGWFDKQPNGATAVSTAGYVVFAFLVPQMLTVPGVVVAAIRIETKDGSNRASTFPFIVDVAEDPGANTEKSENYYSVQNWDDVNSKFAEIQEILDSFSNTIIDDKNISSKTVWSSKNTVDKLCPSFTESGSVVACEPVEGYPLEVISTINAKKDDSAWDRITLTQCGKNLFDFKKGVEEIYFTSSSGTDTIKYGYAIPLLAGTYTIHATPVSADNKDRFIFLYLNDVNGAYLNVADYLIGGGTNTYLRQGVSSTCASRTFTFDRNVILFVYQGSAVNAVVAHEIFMNEHNIQIEAGSAATAYEPYRGQTIEADLSNNPVTEGSYNWTTGVLIDDAGTHFQHDLDTNNFVDIENEIDSEGYTQPIVRHILALSGGNYFYSDCGDTEVKGKADPVKIIEKLTNSILALGGNV